jgi:predicted outer membrane repeat protein
MKTTVILLSCLMLAMPMKATIIHVPGTVSTIQGGINLSNNGDTVQVAPGVYSEQIRFYGKKILLASQYLTTSDTSFITQTIIDGGAGGSVVTFCNNEDSLSILNGFTVQNGYASSGGGIRIFAASPRILNCRIVNNISYNSGGAINVIEGNLLLENVAILGNNTNGPGGGIFCDWLDSYMRLTGCTISGNHAASGGGIYITNGYSWDIKMTDVLICDNSAGSGGGILFNEVYNFDNSPNLSGVSIYNNSANEGGGIFFSNSWINFDSIHLCNIYLNDALAGQDLYSEYSFAEVYVDTFSVLHPTIIYAYLPGNFDFHIQHGIIQQVSVDLYVSPSGDDGNNGLSPTTPFLTIRHAMEVFYAENQDPHTIHLGPGTYSPQSNGELFPLILTEYASLEGVDKELVILDAEGSGNVLNFLFAPPTRISKLTITGGTSERGGGIYCKEVDLIFRDIIISGNNAMLEGGGIYMESCSPDLLNVIVSGNESAGQGGGIFCKNANPIMKNIVVCNNSASESGGGICCIAGSLPVLMNSTVSHNISPSPGNGLYCHPSYPELTNVILWGDSISEIWAYSQLSHNIPPITIRWSDIEGGQTGIYSYHIPVHWLDGNIDQNPLFTHEEDDPYAIDWSSPCKDSGTPDTSGLALPPFDMLGNVRVWDGDWDGIAIVDMGAYECASVPVGHDIPLPGFRLPGITCRPNPFCSTAILEYEIREMSWVTLSVYNHLGQKVAVLTDEIKDSGKHRTEWDSGNLPSGVYFASFVGENQLKTIRVVLIK